MNPTGLFKYKNKSKHVFYLLHYCKPCVVYRYLNF